MQQLRQIYTEEETLRVQGLLERFTSLGGQFVIFDRGDEQRASDGVGIDSIESKDNQPQRTSLGQFALQPGDMVFPMCHAGQNRSQIVHHLVSSLNRDNSMRVVKPHGAESGYDPCVRRFASRLVS